MALIRHFYIPGLFEDLALIRKVPDELLQQQAAFRDSILTFEMSLRA